MKSIIKDAFEIKLRACYGNIFTHFKLWSVNGINERNLTCNFVNCLQASLKDEVSIACFEVPLSNGASRIDAIVYTPKHNTIFFLEAKKFKRNQPKYIDSVNHDIERLLEPSNRESIIKKITNPKVVLNQYLIIIADHWSLNDSDIIVNKWFLNTNNHNSSFRGLTDQNNRYIYYNSFESAQSGNERYMIYLSCLEL